MSEHCFDPHTRYCFKCGAAEMEVEETTKPCVGEFTYRETLDLSGPAPVWLKVPVIK